MQATSCAKSSMRDRTWRVRWRWHARKARIQRVRNSTSAWARRAFWIVSIRCSVKSPRGWTRSKASKSVTSWRKSRSRTSSDRLSRKAFALLVPRCGVADVRVDIGGRRHRWMAASKRRSRIVFEPELDPFCLCFAVQSRHEREAEVDTGRHTPAGDEVAVLDDAVAHRHRAEHRQHVDVAPVRRRPAALQEPGDAKQQSTGTDRGDVLRAPAGALDEIQQRVIPKRTRDAVAAGDEQHVDGRRVVDRMIGSHRRREVRRHRLPRSRDHDGTRVWRAREHVERAREVQEFEAGEDEHADRGHARVLSRRVVAGGRPRAAVGLRPPMLVYEFAVESTVPDNTAFTVLTALRELGYEALDRVERADILRLRMREGAMPIGACAAALKRAEIVFNPNKHRLGYSGSPDTPAFEAVVADKDDDT